MSYHIPAPKTTTEKAPPFRLRNNTVIFSQGGTWSASVVDQAGPNVTVIDGAGRFYLLHRGRIERIGRRYVITGTIASER